MAEAESPRASAGIDRSVRIDLASLVGLRTLAGVQVSSDRPFAQVLIDDVIHSFAESVTGGLEASRSDAVVPASLANKLPSMVVEFRIRETTAERVLYAIRESDGLVVLAVGEALRMSSATAGWNIDNDITAQKPRREALIMWSEEGFTPRWLGRETKV